ncbi:MAG: outer membrane beta-barrel family protein, partial [Gemmatimonadaceae bacterium]
IINIVLKQDIEVGLSAAINVAAGSTGMMNASGNVARQQGRWKWYVSPFLSRDTRSNRQSLDRENLLAGPALVTSRTTGAIHPRGGGATVRTEYKLTDRDLLSLDASTYQSRFRNESQTDWVNADASGAPLGRFAQNTEFSTRASFSDASLTWRRMTKDQQVPASMELRWNDSPNTLRILSASSIEQEDPSIADVEEGLLRQRTASSTPTVVWQGDWFRQFGTVVKLEGGAKATWRRTESDGGAWRQPSGQAEQPIEDRTIESRYREDFQAVYGVLSERAGKWTLQQGLRVENTDTRLSARSAAQGAAPVVAQHYLSPFPSAVASYAFSDTRSVRASYSRRISRPYAGSVTPLSYRMNQRTVTSGNPELRPEYTDALELTWQDAFRWGTVQVEPYLRRTNDAVRWLRRVNDAGVSITTPTNMARIDLSGVDVTLGLRRGGAQANLTGSLYHYRSRADTLPSIYSARASWWGVRANGSWRVQKATTLQLNSFYRPSRRVEAGTTRPLGYLNGGIRRTFAEGKGSVNLSITDPFNWQQFRSTFTDGRVSDFTVFRTESRTVSLSVSRSFGQQVRIRGRAGQDDATTAPPPTP